MANPLPHQLDRQISIRAPRAAVFRHFVDAERFAAWWGAGSSVDPQPGGSLRIRYPNGTTASGAVIEVVPDQRFSFSFGYDDPGKPIPPGGSRVSIVLDDEPEGTRLSLVHQLADAATRDLHVQGWRFQLSVLANVATRAHLAGVDATMDAFFAAWAEPDADRRARAFGAVVAPSIVFRDAFSTLEGLPDLVAHAGASQQHMPGIRLTRQGPVRLCQGTGLCDWRAIGPDGSARGAGVNVVEVGPDGRLVRLVGFWAG